MLIVWQRVYLLCIIYYLFDKDVSDYCKCLRILKFLKQANLEKYGFVKSTEVSTETDENGKKTTKTTTKFSAMSLMIASK